MLIEPSDSMKPIGAGELPAPVDQIPCPGEINSLPGRVENLGGLWHELACGLGGPTGRLLVRTSSARTVCSELLLTAQLGAASSVSDAWAENVLWGHR
jgi:hypothetical protein